MKTPVARPALAFVAGLAVLAALGAAPVFAQRPPDPEILMAAQREAMAALAFMDGVWRGPAWATLPDGKRHDLIQTERIGSFLGGTVKIFEGRGYNPDGSVGFNALGILSYDPMKKAYSLRSYAMGHSGDFPITIRPDGFDWEVPMGPMRMKYSATIKDGTFKEIGERIAPGKEPVRVLELDLKRVSGTDWPAANPVPMR